MSACIAHRRCHLRVVKCAEPAGFSVDRRRVHCAKRLNEQDVGEPGDDEVRSDADRRRRLCQEVERCLDGSARRAVQIQADGRRQPRKQRLGNVGIDGKPSEDHLRQLAFAAVSDVVIGEYAFATHDVIT
jgi:hypothetical protein